MKKNIRTTTLTALLICTGIVHADTAQKIIDETGIQGGVIVHIGCGDGELTTELHLNDRYIVQGLDTNDKNIRQARKAIMSAGLYGIVTADKFDGKNLPYADGIINLIVTEDLGKVSKKEAMRVLCPNGVLFIKDKKGKKTVKKSPTKIDDWTHYMYDAKGECVSKDTTAGPPRGLKWRGGPKWARSHEHTASMHALVSANGRIFYVMDEGPTESIQLPSDYILTARDAFNGTILWKKHLKNWFNHLYPLKSGPGYMPRRLVAVGDKVYIAPGTGQNLLELDAATGAVLHEYSETESTFELINSDNVVFAAIDPEHKAVDYKQEHPNCWTERNRANNRWGWKENDSNRNLKAIKTDTGKTLWKKSVPIAPMTLVADDKIVCFYTGKAVVALDRKNGKELWSSDKVSKISSFKTGYAGPRLLIHDDYVIFSPRKELTALSAETGKLKWHTQKQARSGHYSPEDVFVIDDIVWVAKTAGKHNQAMLGYDLKTGEETKHLPNDVDAFYIHQRCHPGKATEKYFIPGQMGITYVNQETEKWDINHWVRGGCIYGLMPANGLIYASPHACACYYQSKLNYFNGIGPEAAHSKIEKPRFIKGPAYTEIQKADPKSDDSKDWPYYRHDNKRSGYVKTDVASDTKQAWQYNIGGKLSQATCADGRVFVSAIDKHTVHALDADSGKELWEFTAGGRVDSPPAVYKGTVFFGSADGYIYAVNAKNGKTAWKFRAAPNSQQIINCNQLESVWPVHGSVLIQNNTLYCIAGRSMFLDGGLRMIRLNPVTGKLLSENIMDKNIPGTDKNLQTLMTGKHMPITLPDVLSCDEKYVYMKSQTFDMNGKRIRIEPQRPDTQHGEEVHLFSPIGFLDDSWIHRGYWIYGRAAGEGWAEFQHPPKIIPYGRIICLDDNNAYGYARDTELLCNSSINEYRLYSANKTPAKKAGVKRLEGKGWPKREYKTDYIIPGNTVDWKKLSKQPKEKMSALKYNWINENPKVMAKAMVLANDTIFMAGQRDVVDEKAMWGKSNAQSYQQKMKLQAENSAGKHGSVLLAVSKKTGKTLSRKELDFMPVFDGMIAADGKLIMSTADGKLVCFK